jgi:hypothetical protein
MQHGLHIFFQIPGGGLLHHLAKFGLYIVEQAGFVEHGVK